MRLPTKSVRPPRMAPRATEFRPPPPNFGRPRATSRVHVDLGPIRRPTSVDLLCGVSVGSGSIEGRSGVAPGSIRPGANPEVDLGLGVGLGAPLAVQNDWPGGARRPHRRRSRWRRRHVVLSARGRNPGDARAPERRSGSVGAPSVVLPVGRSGWSVGRWVGRSCKLGVELVSIRRRSWADSGLGSIRGGTWDRSKVDLMSTWGPGSVSSRHPDLVGPIGAWEGLRAHHDVLVPPALIVVSVHAGGEGPGGAGGEAPPRGAAQPRLVLHRGGRRRAISDGAVGLLRWGGGV